MSRQYTKVAEISKEVIERKAAGETNREIAERYGVTKAQIKGLVKRENRKARLVAQGYTLQPKGRPRKDTASEAVRRENELIQLRMMVELLRNFLSEAGSLQIKSQAPKGRKFAAGRSARKARQKGHHQRTVAERKA